MAHRLPMMVGLGGLHTGIEQFGTIDPQLRALLNPSVWRNLAPLCGARRLPRSTACRIEWASATPSA